MIKKNKIMKRSIDRKEFLQKKKLKLDEDYQYDEEQIFIGGPHYVNRPSKSSIPMELSSGSFIDLVIQDYKDNNYQN